MTMTVIDPAGTPVLVFNRDGVTIDVITAAGTNQATATPITRHCGWTVVLISASGSAGVQLPGNAEIGDLVELHGTSGTGGFLVWPAVGDQIMYGGANNADSGAHILYRYISANNWLRVSV